MPNKLIKSDGEWERGVRVAWYCSMNMDVQTSFKTIRVKWGEAYSITDQNLISWGSRRSSFTRTGRIFTGRIRGSYEFLHRFTHQADKQQGRSHCLHHLICMYDHFWPLLLDWFYIRWVFFRTCIYFLFVLSFHLNGPLKDPLWWLNMSCQYMIFPLLLNVDRI